MVIVKAFKNEFFHFTGTFFGIKVSVEAGRHVMKETGGDGILLYRAARQQQKKKGTKKETILHAQISGNYLERKEWRSIVKFSAN